MISTTKMFFKYQLTHFNAKVGPGYILIPLKPEKKKQNKLKKSTDYLKNTMIYFFFFFCLQLTC
jgi:hypothetical protein